MPDPGTDGFEEDSEIESNEEYAVKVSAANSDYLLLKYIRCCAMQISTTVSQVFDVTYDFLVSYYMALVD
jgi:hypothetical protein